jgi:hypothetical protein
MMNVETNVGQSIEIDTSIPDQFKRVEDGNYPVKAKVEDGEVQEVFVQTEDEQG